jgi:hypothetical protein
VRDDHSRRIAVIGVLRRQPALMAAAYTRDVDRKLLMAEALAA